MSLLEQIGVYVGLSEFIVQIIVSAIILVLGVLIGKFVSIMLRRALERARITHTNGYGFLKRLLIVIEWSIYVLFLSLALKVLGIPKFSDWLSSVLLVIPALVGGLLIITIGFAISNYLGTAILESKLHDKETLAKIFYFFVLGVFMVFAFKTALISLNEWTANITVVILTAIVSLVVAYCKIREPAAKASK